MLAGKSYSGCEEPELFKLISGDPIPFSPCPSQCARSISVAMHLPFNCAVITFPRWLFGTTVARDNGKELEREWQPVVGLEAKPELDPK